MKLRNIIMFPVFICIFLLFNGCDSTKEEYKTEFTEDENSIIASRIIGSNGGSIDYGDGTILTIPKNAISDETTISVSKIKDAPSIGEVGIEFIQLEPSGLNLAISATLKIQYQEYEDFNENLIAVYTFNESTNNWEKLQIINQSENENYIEVSITHFSWVLPIFNRPLDLIMEIPGKYLSKSDLIFCLAKWWVYEDEFHWFPGHVGLYLGTEIANSTDNDGYTIIESSPPNGVHTDYHTTFIDVSHYLHIYMGARRYDGTITDNNRTNIAAYAISKIGYDYWPVGQSFILEGVYSCVGLTEAAYDHVWKSIIPLILEFPFIIPLEQYIRTLPVDEITVKSNEELQIPIKGVVWDESATSYTDDASKFDLSVFNLPSGANINNNVFTWTPEQFDVGNIYIVNFLVTAEVNGVAYARYQPLTINVEQGQINNYIEVNSNPTGASIYLDGTNLDMVTPATLTDVNAGNHHIRLYKFGYNEYNEYFYYEGNNPYIINANLGNPLPPLPVFTIDEPTDGAHFNDNVINVSGFIHLEDAYGNTLPFNGDNAILTLNGVDHEIIVSSGNFDVNISIVSGENTIQLRANSENGDTGVSDEITVYGDFSSADIEITLTWNTPTSDLDLHVWNPNGEHCYYMNMNITEGSLDIDDVDGYGPETFTAENAINGTYIVKVNCYNLWSDNYSDATVQVLLNGSSVQTFGPHHFTVYDFNGNNPEAWWEVTTFTMSKGKVCAKIEPIPERMIEKIKNDMKCLPAKNVKK